MLSFVKKDLRSNPIFDNSDCSIKLVCSQNILKVFSLVSVDYFQLHNDYSEVPLEATTLQSILVLFGLSLQLAFFVVQLKMNRHWTILQLLINVWPIQNMN